jgi:hypothetical protein
MFPHYIMNKRVHDGAELVDVVRQAVKKTKQSRRSFEDEERFNTLVRLFASFEMGPAKLNGIRRYLERVT